MRYFADCSLGKLLTMTDEEIAKFGICVVNEEYTHKREDAPYAPFLPQTRKGYYTDNHHQNEFKRTQKDGRGAVPIWLPRPVFFLSLAYFKINNAKKKNILVFD